MAITKEKLISDIELQLYQGTISDDNELEKNQIAQWIQYHLHSLQRQEITTAINSGQLIPSIYIITESGLEMSEENVEGISDSKQRFWIDLTNNVLDLPDDRGIVRVEDYDGNLILKTSIEHLSMTRDLRFSKPSLNNVLYYRIGKKVFLEGFNTADTDFNDIIVHYVPKQDILALNDSDEVLVSDMILPVLIDLVVARGKAELLGSVPADQENDGVQKVAPIYHSQISNPAKNQPQE